MKVKTFIKNNTTSFARVSFIVLAVCTLIKVVAVFFEPFADFFNRHVASVTRAMLSYLTAFIPFSLAETLVISAIPFAIIYIICFTKRMSESDDYAKQVFNLLGLIACLLSLFLINFSIAYDVTPLEKKLDLDSTAITADNLYDASEYVMTQLEWLDVEIVRDENGAAVMPYSFSELTRKINIAYDNLYGEYRFLSPLYAGAKQIALSIPMTYTHIAGVYTFFTGEANINTNYPPYVVAFTTAHEMAHQRGIAPEDEANFVAFLACTTSDDPFLRYCGYAQILEYIGNSLYATDSSRFEDLLYFYPEGVLAEYVAYSNMFKEYSHSKAADVSSAVNDVYLKSQGQTDGTNSYDLVTELATAYILKNIEQ